MAKIECSKCSEEAKHGLLIRQGDLPNPFDPKMKDKDKSGVYSFPFCQTHWDEIMALVSP